MKSLDKRTNLQAAEDECASEIMETVPMVMRAIRAEMRKRRPSGLSVPQFRALLFLDRNEGASVSELAEHVGLTLPSVSKMIDGLMKRGFIDREVSSDDRRRATLALTDAGRSTLKSARQDALTRLAEILESLSESELATVAKGMRILRPAFTPGRAAEGKRDVDR